jgi:hypothetical protein
VVRIAWQSAWARRLDTLHVDPLPVNGDEFEVLDALAVWHDSNEEKGEAR